MMQSKDDPRFRFIVTILVILGVIILVLVAMLMFFGEANQMVQVILAVGLTVSSVMAVALGYNVFARYRDATGQCGQFKAEAPKAD